MTPFDTCLFALLDDGLNVVGNSRVAAENSKFVYLRRDRDQRSLEFVNTLNVLL